MLTLCDASSPFFILSESARHEVMEAIKEHPAQRTTANSSPRSGYDAVVIGLAPKQFDYENLNTAFRILKGEYSSQGWEGNTHEESRQVPLIATHKAKYMQVESGLSLGPGPFVTALETATGLQAHVVGKPAKGFLEMVIRDMQEEFSAGDDVLSSADKRIAIIGDDVEADLGGGSLDLNLWRILGWGSVSRLMCSLLTYEHNQCGQESIDLVMKPGRASPLRMKSSILSQLL